jgi:hypothetical protein
VDTENKTADRYKLEQISKEAGNEFAAEEPTTNARQAFEGEAFTAQADDDFANVEHQLLGADNNENADYTGANNEFAEEVTSEATANKEVTDVDVVAPSPDAELFPSPYAAGAPGGYLNTNEEFAAEAAVPEAPGRRLNQPEDERPASSPMFTQSGNAGANNKTWGWVALIMAIASLFIWPAVLGPAAAVIGFVAMMRGNRALGIWSIVIGLIAFVAYIALVPYYT